MIDSNIADTLTEYMLEQLEAKRERDTILIRYTLRKHFGVSSYEQAMRKFAHKKLALAYDIYNEFIGIIVNNRWLYAANGQVIGKQGKRWMFEELKIMEV